MSHSAHDDAHHGQHTSHAVPFWLLAAVFGALLVLTALTVGITYFDLGYYNLLGAMIIALIKGSLVVLFFMHLWWDKLFNALALITALIFVTLFISISALDTFEYSPNIAAFTHDNPSHVEDNIMRASEAELAKHESAKHESGKEEHKPEMKSQEKPAEPPAEKPAEHAPAPAAP
ncbi:MAG: hypothetical protein GC162_04400 [Planctomycetes bacterium]|nr:hypothetical protein [Planctomycetota bacterium]